MPNVLHINLIPDIWAVTGSHTDLARTDIQYITDYKLQQNFLQCLLQN